MTEKRKRIEDKVLEIVSYLDTKDQFNYHKYKMMFSAMSDAEFANWCKWCNDPKDLNQVDHTVTIQTIPFQEPSIENIYKGLAALDVPAEEYVYFRSFGGDKPIRSRYPIPVGYLNIKKMEQFLTHKNHYTLDVNERNIKTDQTSGASNVANISEAEAQCLISIGADKIMDELYGSRSGDETARNALYKQIAMNGYASLEEIKQETNIDTKTTLNTFNTYMLVSGLRTDLVEFGNKLPYTIKNELKGGNKA